MCVPSCIYRVFDKFGSMKRPLVLFIVVRHGAPNCVHRRYVSQPPEVGKSLAVKKRLEVGVVVIFETRRQSRWREYGKRVSCLSGSREVDFEQEVAMLDEIDQGLDGLACSQSLEHDVGIVLFPRTQDIYQCGLQVFNLLQLLVLSFDVMLCYNRVWGVHAGSSSAAASGARRALTITLEGDFRISTAPRDSDRIVYYEPGV